MTESFNIMQFLKSAVATGASDEHIKVGYPPYIRINGEIKKTNMIPVTRDGLDSAIVKIAPDALKREILSSFDCDFMYEIPGCSRFRINYNRQLGNPGLVVRNIPYDVPAFNSLGLPDIILPLIDNNNGIILVTGPTGSGKSTTIASLIDKINADKAKHVITIEDPIEFVFTPRKSTFSQRQVGVDTLSFADGIKYAMRQDPDIIFIGEIRDKETMEAALKASETGHLVFSTLHTNDAVQTINRIVNMFEESSRDLIRKQLSETLRATIAQRLVYSDLNKRRYPVCEVMTVTSTIKDYIVKDCSDEIYELMRAGTMGESISFNRSLIKLVNDGTITKEKALSTTNDANELEKVFRGIYQGSANYDD